MTVTAGVPVLECDVVARRFADRWVLRGISLRVEPGAVLGVRGRNGSGKTTLLRIAATLLSPTRGSCRVYGYDLVRDRAECRELIGYLGHQAGLYEELTAAENLEFAQRMRGERVDRTAIGDVLERVALAGDGDRRVRAFSAGMRRRLALARLMLRPPRLLLLDEPYASFDADGIGVVNSFALSVAESGGAVLIATHDVIHGHIITSEIRIEGGRIAAAETAGLPGSAPLDAAEVTS
jgi:heme exporter protein A